MERKSIRAKLQQLKQGEIFQESVFTPIKKHLKNIEPTLQNPERNQNESVKSELKPYQTVAAPPINLKTPSSSSNRKRTLPLSATTTTSKYDAFRDVKQKLLEDI